MTPPRGHQGRFLGFPPVGGAAESEVLIENLICQELKRCYYQV
jgi:hypothetical protein